MIPQVENNKWETIDVSSDAIKQSGSHESSINFNKSLRLMIVRGFYSPESPVSLHGLDLAILPENIKPKEAISIWNGAYFKDTDDKEHPYDITIRVDGRIRFLTSSDILRKSMSWNFVIALDDKWDIK